MIELEVEVIGKSAMAINVRTAVGTAWVPRSVVDDYTSTSGELDMTTSSIFIPQWMAEQKGLV